MSEPELTSEERIAALDERLLDLEAKGYMTHTLDSDGKKLWKLTDEGKRIAMSTRN